ncbi:MAG: hypothetical protein ABIH70_04880 [Chloroflexota bacterium]
MADTRENLKIILEKIIKIQPGQNILIATHPFARSRSIAFVLDELCRSMGAQTMVATMEPSDHIGQEPPPNIIAAIKASNIVLEISERASFLGHTTAVREARAAGTRRYMIPTEATDYYSKDPISFEALEIVKKRGEKLAEMMTKANTARITTPYGTDVTMSLKDRKAIAIHPLSGGIVPDYGEAAIAPVEGSTEGVVVADASVRGWGYLLRKPIRFEVKKGRVQLESIRSDMAEQAERFKKSLSLDQNANNCAAELGLGINHILSQILRGTYASDYATIGTYHIACGRNNDIGGQTLSTIHQDVLMTGGNVKLDDVTVIENGEMKLKV